MFEMSPVFALARAPLAVLVVAIYDRDRRLILAYLVDRLNQAHGLQHPCADVRFPSQVLMCELHSKIVDLLDIIIIKTRGIVFPSSNFHVRILRTCSTLRKLVCT